MDIRDLTKKAFDDDERIYAASLRCSGEKSSLTRHAVILIPGIRDYGSWIGVVTKILEKDACIESIPIKPDGYFDIVRFLIPFFHGFAERWTEARIRRVVKDSNYKKISIIAHSFGTHCVSKYLEQSGVSNRICRVILCGAIVSEKFDWGRCEVCFEEGGIRRRVLNECGTRDIWPIIAKWWNPWKFGASGRMGASFPGIIDRFQSVGHSGFFTEEFVKNNWLPFIEEGRVVEGDKAGPEPRWIEGIATVPWLSAWVILPVVTLILWWVW